MLPISLNHKFFIRILSTFLILSISPTARYLVPHFIIMSLEFLVIISSMLNVFYNSHQHKFFICLILAKNLILIYVPTTQS
jgi:hypothetical protein